MLCLKESNHHRQWKVIGQKISLLKHNERTSIFIWLEMSFFHFNYRRDRYNGTGFTNRQNNGKFPACTSNIQMRITFGQRPINCYSEISNHLDWICSKNLLNGTVQQFSLVRYETWKLGFFLKKTFRLNEWRASWSEAWNYYKLKSWNIFEFF